MTIQEITQQLAIEYAGHRLFQMLPNSTEDAKIDTLCRAYEESLPKITAHLTQSQPDRIATAFGPVF
jgi:hypothetical protein